jgi:hypothetical protein
MVLALAAVLALAVAPGHSERANATVLVENTAGTLPGPQGEYGQSVTTPDGGPFTNISFSFGESDVRPNADLFVLSQEFLELPSEAPSAPGFIAKSISSSGGVYRFSPTVTLNSNQQYFFYSDAPSNTASPPINQSNGLLIDGDVYTGGNLYYTRGSAVNIASFSLLDANFSLFGTPVGAVPEPASLTILSVGLLGLAVFRRRHPTLRFRRDEPKWSRHEHYSLQ